MATRKTTLTLALGSALATALAAAPAGASENPFASQSLAQGYMVASKAMEGKCGEGKCGSKPPDAKQIECNSSEGK